MIVLGVRRCTSIAARLRGGLALVGLALAATLACSERPGEDSGPPPGEEASRPPAPPDPGPEPRQRGLELGAGKRGSATLMVHGPAELHLRVQGSGQLRFQFQRDPQQNQSLAVPVDAPGKVVKRKVPIPGEGSRAVRIRWEHDDGLELKRLALRDHEPSLPGGAPDRLRGRSVVLIVADALNAANLGCYGNERDTSPHLDRLAAEGARFEVVYSQTAWTVPSVCSIFTGLEQEQHGVLNVGQVLPEQFPTLAESFRDAGYETAAFVQNGLVNREAALDRGFEHFFDGSGPKREGMHAEVLRWIEAEHERPFFLYLHLLPPHSPYTPPEPFLSRFGGVAGSIDGSVASINRVCANDPQPDHPAVQALERLYDGHVAYMDSLVGEIVDSLREHGEDEELAVVFTADHGEAMAQHGFVGHNLHVYDDMLRVPLLLWAPGAELSTGRGIPDPVSLLDLHPTLAELCGVGSPSGGPGHSLAGLLLGRRRPLARLFHLSARYGQRGPDEPIDALQRGVLAGRFKLVHDPVSRQSMLYDLDADPDETRGVQGRHPVLYEALVSELERWTAESAERQAVERFDPSAALQAELEALGYVTPGARDRPPGDGRDEDGDEDDEDGGSQGEKDGSRP